MDNKNNDKVEYFVSLADNSAACEHIREVRADSGNQFIKKTIKFWLIYTLLRLF